jgi:N-acetylneuraminic acid mutarotase
MRHRWWLPVVATCLALVWASSPGSSPAWAQGGSWSLRAPYPAAVNEVAVVGVGNKIHVLGGSVLGVAGPYHEVYDPETDKWSARAMLPRGLDHIGAAVANGKIYSIGGFVGSVHRDAQNAVYEYDPASDTWRILPGMNRSASR